MENNVIIDRGLVCVFFFFYKNAHRHIVLCRNICSVSHLVMAQLQT